MEIETMVDATQAKYDLEDMIDKNGLRTIASLLIDICREKAEHIETNWQDKTTAKPWARAAKEFERAWSKID
jgi:hypothetical protein